MRRFWVFLLLLGMIGGMFAVVGCMNNRWGLLYDGKYSSADRVQAYADKHGLTYQEAFDQLHSEEQQMWGHISEQQQKGQPPTHAIEAKQVDPVL